MKTRKILINSDFGGFSLSDKAIEVFLNKKDVKFTTQKKKSLFSGRNLIFYINGEYFTEHNLKRDDFALIETVEELGLKESADNFAALKIVEIPYDVDWKLQDYDGMEWIAEKHRTWR
jgi:hypothetical protein